MFLNRLYMTNLWVDRFCFHSLWRESILVVNPMRKDERELTSKSADGNNYQSIETSVYTRLKLTFYVLIIS